MPLQGRVENGVVVFENGSGAPPLPNGTIVEITPVRCERIPVSKERHDALLQLIGICKTERPPSDEEAERIVEEAKTKKYG